MEFRQEGEWVVSTPLLAGHSEAVERARTCGHAWTEEGRKVEKAHLMLFERCSACKVATRVKYRQVSAGEAASR